MVVVVELKENAFVFLILVIEVRAEEEKEETMALLWKSAARETKGYRPL